jgi:23S rRNA pseudouridine1911/1915/1917 synthase
MKQARITSKPGAGKDRTEQARPAAKPGAGKAHGKQARTFSKPGAGKDRAEQARPAVKLGAGKDPMKQARTFSKPAAGKDRTEQARPTVKAVPGKTSQTFLTVTKPAGLMEFLMEKLQGKKRTAIKSLLTHHQVSVEHKPVTQFDHPLEPGQQVTVTWTKVQQKSTFKGLRIVFEDPHLIVIDKSPGLLSIATDKEKERTAYRILSDAAKKINQKSRIFVVHRLDKDASGLMMYAKSKSVQETLQGSWSRDVLERSYVVAVEGRVEKDEDTIVSWLKETKSLSMISSPTPNGGQRAVTRYRVLKRSKGYTLLEVHLETGRKNQIRIHMKDLGHVIVGDRKYGSQIKFTNRLALHARVLSFKHPVTGELLRFETPIPPAFLSLFKE